MTTRPADPREWRVVGYYPEKTDDEKMKRRKIHLNHHIECSKSIGTLLTGWLWNTLIAGGIALSATLVFGVIALFISYIGAYIR